MKLRAAAFIIVLLIILGLLYAAIKMSTPVSPVAGPEVRPAPSETVSNIEDAIKDDYQCPNRGTPGDCK